jgi:hypothetical protein
MTITPIIGLLLLSAPGGEAPSDTAKKAEPAAPAPSAFPWDLNRKFRFVWVQERKKVGETTFQLLDEPAPTGSPSKRVFRSVANFWNKTEGRSIEGRHDTVLSENFRPIRFQTLHLFQGLNRAHSELKQEGAVAGGKLTMTTVSNRDEAGAVRPEPMEAPADAYILLNQSVDNFAIIASHLLRAPKDHDARILYPDLLKCYEVHFAYEGEDFVDLGKPERPKCRRYSFRSKEGQVSGRVWLDARGRMVQYEQGNLRIYLDE